MRVLAIQYVLVTSGMIEARAIVDDTKDHVVLGLIEPSDPAFAAIMAAIDGAYLVVRDQRGELTASQRLNSARSILHRAKAAALRASEDV